jgi:transcriptional regulator with XRE-family HTH domain
MAKSISDLRRERGYRSAREFAEALGISPSSMSRYDREPESIPMKAAWAMADALGCSIDDVVGRDHVAPSALQDFYDGLLPESRRLLDDFLEFVGARDAAERGRRRAERDRARDGLCRLYERMFCQALLDEDPAGAVSVLESPQRAREAFRSYLEDLHRAELDDELPPEAEGEGPEGEEWQRGEVDEMMEAYDRIHAGELRWSGRRPDAG